MTVKRNKLFDKCLANIDPETRKEVRENMAQEDKELLLKDLCARLPYLENWVQFEGEDYIITGYGHGRVFLLPSLVSSCTGPCPLIEEVKPYLRPMSSMTEEEDDKYMTTFDIEDLGGLPSPCTATFETFDWLNEHHFDFRGLIKKGLALEAPSDMYKTE